MANIKCFVVSSVSPISPKTFLQSRSINLAVSASFMAATHKWGISRELTLISPPSSHNYSSGYHNLPSSFSEKHERQMKEIGLVLREMGEDPIEGLGLIDTLQRLSIDYYFQEEIEAALLRQYQIYSNPSYPDSELYEVSTRFRLLRQEGYDVNADEFRKFTDEEGQLKSELRGDIRGLISLYEASQLSMGGEGTLDRAGEFSAQILRTSMANLDPRQARVVCNTLRHPCHKSLASLMARKFIPDHKFQNRWVNMFQEAAEMELSLVQAIHRKEMLEVSKWCKDTGLLTELKFARNQPLKWHMWSMGALTDPSLSEERVDLTKSIWFIYIIDDIFDVYGTIDELTLFIEAINRWDLAAFDQLPDYMRNCFKALDQCTNEISYKIYKKHSWNPVDSLRKTWVDLCNAFLAEAKWFASGQLPKADEYLKNGIISSGLHVTLVHLFFLLGLGFSNPSINRLNNNPSIITSVATILRLWDDLGSAKDENQDGHDGSFVECYMKDTGSSQEAARKKVMEIISDSWKCLNKEALSQHPFPASFRKGCLNMARMVPLMYDYDENRSFPILEEHIMTILSDSFTS